MVSGSRHFPRPSDFCPPAHAPPLAPNSDTNSMHMCSLAREVLPHTDTQPGPLPGRFQGLHCLQHFSTCLVSPQNPPIVLRRSPPPPSCLSSCSGHQVYPLTPLRSPPRTLGWDACPSHVLPWSPCVLTFRPLQTGLCPPGHVPTTAPLTIPILRLTKVRHREVKVLMQNKASTL